MVKIGEKVKDLKIEVFQNNNVKEINLSDYKGKWLILFFYPADFTFICPTELEEMADKYEKFKELGAEVISISKDTTFVHKAWHDNSKAISKVKFPMGADPTGRISKEFGTYLEDEGVSLRGTFIIDPEGILKAFEMHDNSIGRSADELMRKLQAAIFVKKNKGQVCPAEWKPGKESLKPSLDLVGKI